MSLKCHWTITSKDESLTVTITYLKWTFNYDFRVRVTAHSQGAPNVSKQKDRDDHQPMPRSLVDALNLYEAFPEPHLNPHQLDNLVDWYEKNITNATPSENVRTNFITRFSDGRS